MAHHARKIAAAPAKAGVEAEGVDYTTSDAAPGLKLFRCEPHRATLSMVGCGKRWREAQEATGAKAEEWHACRSCAIGAAHAGEDPVIYSWLFGAAICPRCRKGTTRMIGGRVCVGCRNREYELARGTNARGNVPVELLQRAPRARSYRLVVDGIARRETGVGVDLFEPVMQTMRTTKGSLAFAFGPTPSTRQGRLF